MIGQQREESTPGSLSVVRARAVLQHLLRDRHQVHVRAELHRRGDHLGGQPAQDRMNLVRPAREQELAQATDGPAAQARIDRAVDAVDDRA